VLAKLPDWFADYNTIRPQRLEHDVTLEYRTLSQAA
jgi:hypothetical protein